MIDKIFPETLKILKNLVKFQTVSGMPNLELIEYCEQKLAEVGATNLPGYGAYDMLFGEGTKKEIRRIG